MVRFYYENKVFCDCGVDRRVDIWVVSLSASIAGVYRVVLEVGDYFLSIWFDINRKDMLCYSWGFPCGELQSVTDMEKGKILAWNLARLSVLESGRLY